MFLSVRMAAVCGCTFPVLFLFLLTHHSVQNHPTRTSNPTAGVLRLPTLPVFSFAACPDFKCQVAQRDRITGGGWKELEHQQHYRGQGRLPEASEGPLGGPVLPQPQVRGILFAT